MGVEYINYIDWHVKYGRYMMSGPYTENKLGFNLVNKSFLYIWKGGGQI